MQTIPPGWYDDSRGNLRWWSGEAWTERVKPLQPVAPVQTIEERAQAHLQKVWSEEKASSALTPFVSQESEEPLTITFFNGKKQALVLQDRLDRAKKTVAELNGELAGKVKRINELESTLEVVDGLSLVDATRLVRATRLAYDEATTEIDEQFAAQRRELEAELNARLQAVNSEYATVKANVADLEFRRAQLTANVVELTDLVELQDVGYYDFEHPAQSSVQLSADLTDIRNQIKAIQKAKTATSALSGFTFNNSAAQGRKFVADMSSLLLRSYNAEAENCIKSVKSGNLQQASARLEKAKEQAEKLGKMIDLKISSQFHRLRLREMEIASSHLQALAVEKELERERREELREAKRVEEELTRKRKQLEDELKREREKYQRSVEALRARGDFEAITRMDAEIVEIEKGIADVDYRAANLKAGYVYIISNIGAFGKDIVKIGLTRRLDPLDRVKELSGASVPFRFDVHAIIFSNDAPALEASLHRRFAAAKVNKANPRKEFFRTTPQAVLEALKHDNVEVLEFVLEPEAEEWKASQPTV